MMFKCKMCGGELALESGSSVGVCQYCGSTQTLPRLDDDKRANLYERAGHFRRQNDFDKAAALYETILNEDRTDSEAYWSLVLCKYGVEYVEDPSTRKRVITCHRTQYASVLADEDYKQALANADASQRAIYEQEAKAIDAIQKGILEVSSKEDPFDVFICYKESDASGKRTPDSVLAQDMYHQLTNEGFKVFFSRITLEDKLGSAYEPYIFAALQSSKIMVVVGSKPEYFNAVWVKNEWGRYLGLIKGGAKKTLIPAYKDMDPYSLPDEFSHLQAQDMGKLGFMQDLVRGIKKIVNPASAQAAQTAGGPAHTAATASTQSLMQRAFIELEDGNWSKADELLEQVLNVEPQNVRAYVGKLMASMKIGHEADLSRAQKRLADQGNFQKAMRFADDAYKATLQGYSDSVEAILENLRKQAIYDAAVAAAGKLEQATKSSSSLAEFARDCRAVAGQFRSISGFSDADKWVSTMEGRAAKGDAMSVAELKREKRSKAVKKSIKLGIFGAIAFIILFFAVIKPRAQEAAAKRAEQVAIAAAEAKEKKRAENEKRMVAQFVKAQKTLESGEDADAIKAQRESLIEFGNYTWRILDVQDGKALIITDELIEERQYNVSRTTIVWENSTIRKYLNEDFLNQFSPSERERIEYMQHDNPPYGRLGGKKTYDYVFLLSLDEAKRYFRTVPVEKTKFASEQEATKYYQDKGSRTAVFAEGNDNAGIRNPWWLRTPGSEARESWGTKANKKTYDLVMSVDWGGEEFYDRGVEDDIGVRPALWLILKE